MGINTLLWTAQEQQHHLIAGLGLCGSLFACLSWIVWRVAFQFDSIIYLSATECGNYAKSLLKSVCVCVCVCTTCCMSDMDGGPNHLVAVDSVMNFVNWNDYLWAKSWRNSWNWVISHLSHNCSSLFSFFPCYQFYLALGQSDRLMELIFIRAAELYTYI